MNSKLVRYREAVNQYNSLLQEYGETIAPITSEQQQIATVLEDLDNGDVQQFITSLHEIEALLPDQPHGFREKLRLKRTYTETIETRIAEQLSIAANMWERIKVQTIGGLCTPLGQQAFNTTVSKETESQGKTYENHYFYVNIPDEKYMKEQEKANLKKLESTLTQEIKRIDYYDVFDNYSRIECLIREYGYNTFAVCKESNITRFCSPSLFRFVADKLYRELGIVNKQLQEQFNNSKYFVFREILFIRNIGFVFVFAIKDEQDFQVSEQSGVQDRSQTFKKLVKDCAKHVEPVEKFFVNKLHIINESYYTGLPFDKDRDFRYRKLRPFVCDTLKQSFTTPLPASFNTIEAEKCDNNELLNMKLYPYNNGQLYSYYSIYQNIIAGETVFGIKKQLIFTGSHKVQSAMINDIHQTLSGAITIMNEYLPDNEFFTVKKIVYSYDRNEMITVFTVKNIHAFTQAPFIQTLIAFNTLVIEHNRFISIVEGHLHMVASRINIHTTQIENPIEPFTSKHKTLTSPNIVNINEL